MELERLRKELVADPAGAREIAGKALMTIGILGAIGSCTTSFAIGYSLLTTSEYRNLSFLVPYMVGGLVVGVVALGGSLAARRRK